MQNSAGRKIDVDELKYKLAENFRGTAATRKTAAASTLDISNSMSMGFKENFNGSNMKGKQQYKNSNGRSKSPGAGLSMMTEDMMIPEKGSAVKG